MKTINRSAVAVMPAQPFLDWLHQADPTSAYLSLNDLRLEPTIYLLPEYDTKKRRASICKGGAKEIFEEQLDGWYRAPTAWPADRSFNYVILALGNGGLAFYAHLQPGRLRVKPGDRVRRGQVLGLLGNSGNSDAPHLHFHISDANSLESEGLPYVFDSFETLVFTAVRFFKK